MMNEMNKISRDRAMMLAQQYKNDPEMKYIVFNIRSRSYVLHNPYQYHFRFSRRESVWNSRIMKLEGFISPEESVETIANAIFNHVNKIAEDTVNFKLKSNFDLEDCATMLRYYFNGKCYLAYYDYYLGRVCLIKERDKSADFSTLVGSRYYFIDDLHNVIQYKLGLSSDFLKAFLNGVMKEDKIIPEIEGFEELNTRLHAFMVEEISKIETWLSENKLKGKRRYN